MRPEVLNPLFAEADTLPGVGAQVAKLLKRLPGLRWLRGRMRGAAEAGWLPVAARAFSLRLYRAALYAEAV